MSTIPLSSVDHDPRSEEQRVEDYNAQPPENTHTKLDKHVADVVERLYPAEDSKPEKKSLDTLISEGLDKHEAAVEDRESFGRSKEARTKFDSRYSKYEGHTTAKMLDTFLNMAEELKRSPQAAAQQIAASYLRASPYALENTPKPKDKPEAFVDAGGKRNSTKVLDAIIDDASETAPKERETFEATAKQRERMKQLWPEL